MKIYIVLFLLLISSLSIKAQSTNIHNPYYKAVTLDIDHNTGFVKALILLHEIYDGTPLPGNFVVGKLMALRGTAAADLRQNTVDINSGSAYTRIQASIHSSNSDDLEWKLKTCLYNGKRYMALEVPYRNPHHKEGYHFVGWVKSTGESLKVVTYEINGVPQNQEFLSNVQNFSPNMTTQQQVGKFIVSGNVGIGTTDPKAKLAVDGNILAKEIKVKTDISVPDYVFEPEYELTSLSDIEAYVKAHKHLPEIPSARDIERHGLDLAEMNLLLLKKVEELTLHLIEKDKEIKSQRERITNVEKALMELIDQK